MIAAWSTPSSPGPNRRRRDPERSQSAGLWFQLLHSSARAPTLAPGSNEASLRPRCEFAALQLAHAAVAAGFVGSGETTHGLRAHSLEELRYHRLLLKIGAARTSIARCRRRSSRDEADRLGLAQMVDIQSSTSTLLRGSTLVRFSLPSEVIRMSSSILTPMPRRRIRNQLVVRLEVQPWLNRDDHARLQNSFAVVSRPGPARNRARRCQGDARCRAPSIAGAGRPDRPVTPPR